MSRTNRPTAPMLPPAARGVLRDLRAFHAVGVRSLKRRERMGYGEVNGEALRHGLHPEMLRKARQFAGAYSAGDVKRLVSLCEKQGHALGLSHVIRLLTVPAAQRWALTREAARGAWGHARLGREIQKRFGSRMPAAGRRRRAPSDLVDVYFEIARLCDQWRRLSEAMRRDPEGLLHLTPAVRERVRRADEVMRELGGLAAKRLGEKRRRGEQRDAHA